MFVVGVDLGGTKTAVSLWSLSDREPARIGRVEWQTERGEPEVTIDRMAREAEALLTANGAEPRAVGISAGGLVDIDTGSVVSIPNLPGWEDVPLLAALRDRLDTSAAIENDANAGALAEWRFGAGRGTDHVVFLTFSTGLGAGMILDGRLYRGARGFAGEVGHLTVEAGGLECGCGRLGCLEAYASGAGMARRLELGAVGGDRGPRTAREVVDLARAGDKIACEFLAETAAYLARGIAVIAQTVNPERIILGTIAAAAGDLILAPLRRELGGLLWPASAGGVDVEHSGLWPDLGDYAALAIATAALE